MPKRRGNGILIAIIVVLVGAVFRLLGLQLGGGGGGSETGEETTVILSGSAMMVLAIVAVVVVAAVWVWNWFSDGS